MAETSSYRSYHDPKQLVYAIEMVLKLRFPNTSFKIELFRDQESFTQVMVLSFKVKGEHTTLKEAIDCDEYEVKKFPLLNEETLATLILLLG